MNSSYLFAPHIALGALVSAACSQLRLPVQIYDLNLLSKPVCPDIKLVLRAGFSSPADIDLISCIILNSSTLLVLSRVYILILLTLFKVHLFVLCLEAAAASSCLSQEDPSQSFPAVFSHLNHLNRIERLLSSVLNRIIRAALLFTRLQVEAERLLLIQLAKSAVNFAECQTPQQISSTEQPAHRSHLLIGV